MLHGSYRITIQHYYSISMLLDDYDDDYDDYIAIHITLQFMLS